MLRPLKTIKRLPKLKVRPGSGERVLELATHRHGAPEYHIEKRGGVCLGSQHSGSWGTTPDLVTPSQNYIEGDAGCLIDFMCGCSCYTCPEGGSKGVGLQNLPWVRIPFDREGQSLALGPTGLSKNAGFGVYLIWPNSCLVYQKRWVLYPVTQTVVEAGALESQGHLLKAHMRPCPKMVVRCLHSTPTVCTATTLLLGNRVRNSPPEPIFLQCFQPGC